MSELNILVVDQNKVHAGFVKESLAEHAAEARVDIAVNMFELKHKLLSRSYSLIIVDLATAQDEDEMADLLSEAKATVVTWSSNLRKKSGTLVKPSTVKAIQDAVCSLVMDNCHLK